MASKIHADLEEGPPDKERASKVLKIAFMSIRASYLLSDHLEMQERSF